MVTQVPACPTPTSSEISYAEEELPLARLAYFRARLTNRIHELVLKEFALQERSGKLSRVGLARRIRRKPEQITRWLGSPGNWTLDTLSDLLLGMGLEPEIKAQSLTSEERLPYQHFVQNFLWRNLHEHISNLVEIQTPEEVIKDFSDGNQKSLYFSVKKQSYATKSIAAIEMQPQSKAPQISLKVSIPDKEVSHDC